MHLQCIKNCAMARWVTLLEDKRSQYVRTFRFEVEACNEGYLTVSHSNDYCTMLDTRLHIFICWMQVTRRLTRSIKHSSLYLEATSTIEVSLIWDKNIEFCHSTVLTMPRIKRYWAEKTWSRGLGRRASEYREMCLDWEWVAKISGKGAKILDTADSWRTLVNDPEQKQKERQGKRNRERRLNRGIPVYYRSIKEQSWTSGFRRTISKGRP